MADGLLWFDDGPRKFAQKFSVAADELDGTAGAVVSEAVDRAVERMQSIVLSGGINQTKKGGARVLSGDMYDEIKGKVTTNGRGRIQGFVGYESPPFYTIFQERGTRSGIASMLAFSTAQGELIVELQDRFEQGDWVPKSLL